MRLSFTVDYLRKLNVRLRMTGRVVVSYVDSSTLVMYECDNLQTDGSCDPNNRFIEVLGRSTSPIDEHSMAKLSPVAESMCLRIQDFEAVTTEGQLTVQGLGS